MASTPVSSLSLNPSRDSLSTCPSSPSLHSEAGNHGASETSPLIPSHTITPKTLTRDSEAASSNYYDPLIYDKQQLIKWRKRLLWAMPCLGIGLFLSAIDQTLIVSIYGTIASDLEALQLADWIATAYFLTLTAFQPLYGKLSDVFGRRACLMFAQTTFGIGCLLCGLARTMNMLIAARALKGIGGAGLGSLVSIIITDVIPLHERGPWTAATNIIFALGAGIGGPIGGALADSVGWRWSFILQVPFAFLAVLGSAFLVKTPKQDSSHWTEKIKRVDFLGAILIITSILTFLIGLDLGRSIGWGSDIMTGCLCACLVSTFLFVLVESKIAVYPIIPGRIVFQKSLSACFICNFSYYGCWMATLFYIPLYLQTTRGYSATEAGLWLIPSVITTLAGVLFAGYYMKWTKRYHRLTAISFILFDAGIIIIALSTGIVFKTMAGVWVGLLVAAFFGGIVNNSLMVATISCVSSDDQASATACYYLFRSLGSVVIISIASSTAQYSLRLKLLDRLSSFADAEEIARLVQENLNNIKLLDPHTMALVKKCYAEAIDSSFMVCAVAAFTTVIGVWFIRNNNLKPR